MALSALICPYLALSTLICPYMPISALICPYLPVTTGINLYQLIPTHISFASYAYSCLFSYYSLEGGGGVVSRFRKKFLIIILSRGGIVSRFRKYSSFFSEKKQKIFLPRSAPALTPTQLGAELTLFQFLHPPPGHPPTQRKCKDLKLYIIPNQEESSK